VLPQKADAYIVNPLQLLKNPMILMGLFGSIFMFGMPKLMENSEPSLVSIFGMYDADHI